jgi:hypothetical protein
LKGKFRFKMKIYIDCKKFYDARYPMQNHWINQIMKKWWEKEQQRKLRIDK